MHQIYTEIGKRIRKIRHSKGITQTELASVVSLSRTSLANIERGRQRIQLHNLYEIAVALNVQPSDLMPGSEILTEKTTENQIPSNISQSDRALIESLLSVARRENTSGRKVQTHTAVSEANPQEQ